MTSESRAAAKAISISADDDDNDDLRPDQAMDSFYQALGFCTRTLLEFTLYSHGRGCRRRRSSRNSRRYDPS